MWTSLKTRMDNFRANISQCEASVMRKRYNKAEGKRGRKFYVIYSFVVTTRIVTVQWICEERDRYLWTVMLLTPSHIFHRLLLCEHASVSALLKSWVRPCLAIHFCSNMDDVAFYDYYFFSNVYHEFVE